MNPVIAYIVGLVVFTAVDLIWLGVVAKGFYRSQLGDLMVDRIKFGAAAFYLIYPLGLVVFAIGPTLQSGSWTDAAARGALLGFIAYAAPADIDASIIISCEADLTGTECSPPPRPLFR